MSRNYGNYEYFRKQSGTQVEAKKRLCILSTAENKENPKGKRIRKKSWYPGTWPYLDSQETPSNS
jgi:hypothetical protein